MGSRLIAVRCALAGPVGSRRPCSQLRSVPTSTCRSLANFGWESPSFERSALIDRASIWNSREGALAAGDLVHLRHRCVDSMRPAMELPRGPNDTVSPARSFSMSRAVQLVLYRLWYIRGPEEIRIGLAQELS